METLKFTKQCPNCNQWFIQQKSFRHHIIHCKRTIADETESAVNQLLSLVSSTSVFEGGNSTIFKGGGNEGSTTVGEIGSSSSLLDFDFKGGHNDNLYSKRNKLQVD